MDYLQELNPISHNKQMFALLRKIKTLDVTYDIQIELFDKYLYMLAKFEALEKLMF